MLERLVFGSGNAHKYEEMRGFFASFPGEFLFGGAKCPGFSVEETGETYEENARIKARAWSLATGLPAVADDSGLEVAALEGRPGLYSSRIGNSDAERRAWVLSSLEGEENREARFVAWVAFCDAAKREEYVVSGECPGTIAHRNFGSEGFGYDPLFIPRGYDKTLGELGGEIKATLSHRFFAVQALLRVLRHKNVL